VEAKADEKRIDATDKTEPENKEFIATGLTGSMG
jgi:hypothetical protein